MTNYLLFIVFIPLIIALNALNFFKNKTPRNIAISIFCILWLTLFHYESTRSFYLEPLFQKMGGKSLPKTRFLFPPAGWIMFFSVDDQFGFREVYGVKGDKFIFIDPHDIIRTRTVGYDNIHRGILGSVAAPRRAHFFCKFLKYRFPDFEKFAVNLNYYPSFTKDPYNRLSKIEYMCPEQ